ncbi:helix-turn-helix domain-containing protein [Streptomyces sp. NPDC058914]|uniref:helix-turn-helix domain-containing protein n=1 Tax=Streptomyces sp. NPDC058914 TaxID=3346671 RepID=UPI0036811E6B
MGTWQPLPDDLPPEVRHFVEQLRQLKDATGLSLAALGARTAYSKSSWQRYLNAVQPPPRQAVAALCRVAGLAGADAERHGVRWELAVEAWPRPTQPPGPQPATAAGPTGNTWTTGTTDNAGNTDNDNAGNTDEAWKTDNARSAGETRSTGNAGDYEDDPTLPWWDRPEEPPPRPAGWRLLLSAVLLLLVLLVVAVGGAVAFG